MPLPLHSLLLLTHETPPPAPCDADAVLCDAALSTRLAPNSRVFLTVGDVSESTLRSLVRLQPDGVVLDGCRTGAEVQRLDVLLSVAEAEEGVHLGQTRILGLTDGLLPPPFSEAGFANKSHRLAGLVWDWRALARTLAVTRFRQSNGSWTDAFALARAATLVAAKAAGVGAYDVAGAAPDADFAEECRCARADGFDGRVTEEAGQVAVINATFRPPP